MVIKSKLSLLAGVISLAGAAYMPQAQANEALGALALGSISTITDKSFAAGSSFTDVISFSVSSAAHLSGFFSSQLESYSGYGATDSSGTSIGSISFLSLSPVVNQNTAHGTILSGLVNVTTTGYKSSFDANVGPGSYEIIVHGTTGVSGPNLGLSGSLNVSAVPEPEEWAMMMLGLPLIGWVARRKQAKLAAA